MNQMNCKTALCLTWDKVEMAEKKCHKLCFKHKKEQQKLRDEFTKKVY